MKNITVIGAGTMGNGIAHVFAMKGFKVNLVDVSEPALQKAIQTISGNLDRMVAKEKITAADKENTLANLSTFTNFEHSANADLVVEAATERVDLKLKIFTELDQICNPDTILASNTSSISITKIAAATKRPDKVIGMHFMNPVPVMKLVEGISAIQTSKETFATIRAVAEKMDKTFVEARDIPGFAVNRILMPMINEAIYTLYEGIASVEDIDIAMKLGTNQPMGPLTLADFIGLDTCLAIMEVLHDGLGDSKYRPCPLLKQYVTAGWLGKKSKRGFYQY